MESAKLDGAGELRILIKIVMPLSTPILATIALFLALAYWNDWYLASLYITDADMWPLQYRLYNILNAASKIAQAGAENLRVRFFRLRHRSLLMQWWRPARLYSCIRFCRNILYREFQSAR